MSEHRIHGDDDHCNHHRFDSGGRKMLVDNYGGSEAGDGDGGLRRHVVQALIEVFHPQDAERAEQCIQDSDSQQHIDDDLGLAHSQRSRKRAKTNPPPKASRAAARAMSISGRRWNPSESKSRIMVTSGPAVSRPTRRSMGSPRKVTMPRGISANISTVAAISHGFTLWLRGSGSCAGLRLAPPGEPPLPALPSRC